jgi:uncharacterized protein YgbK (DUF1537 family)
MPKLLIVADDLTGSNDVGVQFAKQGIASLVTTDLAADFAELFAAADVVVADTESRHEKPDTAARRVRGAVARARAAGAEYFYKKTDSTLRGNPGSELAALLEASGQSILSFVPALPQLGRTTRDGIQYVHELPLHETAFARDPLNPMTESRVATILSRQTDVPVHHGTPDIHSRALQIVIHDAESESDLDEIARALKGAGLLRALAGTAGFAEFLPRVLDFQKQVCPAPGFSGPLLVINGSLNPVALSQISSAIRGGFKSVPLNPSTLVHEGGPCSESADSLVACAITNLAQGRDLVLHSVLDREQVELFSREAERIQLSASDLHRRVAQNTGRLIHRIVSTSRVGTLVVFGGDTLLGIAAAFQWNQFRPLTEMLPGLTASQPAPAVAPLVISKAGGFGAADLLLRLRELVREGSSS